MSGGGPWTPVRLSELPTLAALPHGDLIVLLALRALARDGWRTTRRAVQDATGYTPRYVRFALARLERAHYFRRVNQGSPTDPRASFVVYWNPDRPDPGSEPEPGSPRSGYPDRPDPGTPPSTDSDQTSLPPLPRQGGREARPRADPDALVELARELWPQVARSAARRYCGQLRQHAEGIPEAALASYLRRCADDPSLADAKLPIAVAVSGDRVDAWRRSRARRRPRRPSAGVSIDRDVLSPGEVVSLLQEAL